MLREETVNAQLWIGHLHQPSSHKAQGTARKRGWKDCERQRLEKHAVEGWLLGRTRLLCSDSQQLL